MKKVKSYANEWVWECPYCGSSNYSEYKEPGYQKCYDCNKRVKIY